MSVIENSGNQFGLWRPRPESVGATLSISAYQEHGRELLALMRKHYEPAQTNSPSFGIVLRDFSSSVDGIRTRKHTPFIVCTTPNGIKIDAVDESTHIIENLELGGNHYSIVNLTFRNVGQYYAGSVWEGPTGDCLWTNGFNHLSRLLKVEPGNVRPAVPITTWEVGHPVPLRGFDYAQGIVE
jgi:hypothetical protein